MNWDLSRELVWDLRYLRFLILLHSLRLRPFDHECFVGRFRYRWRRRALAQLGRALYRSLSPEGP